MHAAASPNIGINLLFDSWKYLNMTWLATYPQAKEIYTKLQNAARKKTKKPTAVLDGVTVFLVEFSFNRRPPVAVMLIVAWRTAA